MFFGARHALITFGSPLDKTAFLFSNSVSQNIITGGFGGSRATLILGLQAAAASFNGSISDSPATSSAGKLIYYDLPEQASPPAGLGQRR